MCPWSSDPCPSDAKPKKSNYKVRFRHGVYPGLESQATRADIKKYDYFFGSGQMWVGVPGDKFDFVDESVPVAQDFEGHGGGGSDSGGSSGGTSRRISTRNATRARTSARVPHKETWRSPKTARLSIRPAAGPIDRVLVSAATQPISSYHRQTPSQHDQHTSPAPESVFSLSTSWHGDLPSPAIWTPPTPYTPLAWPLADPIEAQLFRFWVERAADALDIRSSTGIFKKLVLTLALTNSMLMDAIFMISAQQIQRYDPYFPTRPYLYHERILQCLIPYLAEKGRIEDEATLVAAILLRSFEEFHAGTQGQIHLSTHELFLGPEGWLLDISSPIVQACLMVHVHSEICEALLGRPSLRIDYEHIILPFLVSPTDDVAWCNRILWLSARVLQWTGRSKRTVDEWHGLVILLDEWELERPASFNAFFYREENLGPVSYFPELWYSSPCHADANQHLQMCRIALTVNYPDAEIQDTNRVGIAASMRDEVLRNLKGIVAIARCNPHAISVPWNAAHAVHKFAAVLQDDLDQCKMIEFLEEVNAMGWPTAASMEHLREQWRWNLRLCVE
ncbi:hypothetical protein EJ02DRAFT_353871 [Clathrospora elynae]|uniref:Uncharacterized protein n=1 Tax=Clathrospora elynae TaxID=706981 RepID=A0A6A5SGL4_9PLEO|nr:hypothetical protein EJ02DRAFT_353871 [Clathrospora elynae]